MRVAGQARPPARTPAVPATCSVTCLVSSLNTLLSDETKHCGRAPATRARRAGARRPRSARMAAGQARPPRTPARKRRSAALARAGPPRPRAAGQARPPGLPRRSTLSPTLPSHRPHRGRTSTVPARAGTVRRVSGPIPPPACADALAPRRLRVPDLTPSQSREGKVRNTTALLHE